MLSRIWFLSELHWKIPYLILYDFLETSFLRVLMKNRLYQDQPGKECGCLETNLTGAESFIILFGMLKKSWEIYRGCKNVLLSSEDKGVRNFWDKRRGNRWNSRLCALEIEITMGLTRIFLIWCLVPGGRRKGGEGFSLMTQRTSLLEQHSLIQEAARQKHWGHDAGGPWDQGHIPTPEK